MPDQAYFGDITIFAGTFYPINTLLCQGQLLSISQNTALFSLVGTTYGGDGTTTFALPNLCGRAPVGVGEGAGLSNIQLGQAGGVEQVTLTTANMPAHNHSATGGLKVTNQTGDSRSPQGQYLAATSPNLKPYNSSSDGSTLAAGSLTVTLQPAGGSQPVDIRTPYIAMNYTIAVEGIYPTRP